MASCSPFKDYQVGQVLTLGVIPEHGKNHLAPTIRARIRQLQYPRASRSNFDAIMGSTRGRAMRKKSTSTPFGQAQRANSYNLRAIPNFEEDTEETWDDGQVETFLTGQVHELFDTETTMYDTLRDIQGKLVPRLVARVHLDLSLPNDSISRTDAAELLHIKGILLQYIDGFSLSKMQDHAPKSEWQGIVDQAVTIVQVVGDHGILNRDVRPDNFIVQRDRSGCYWVFMIDFGLARLRGWNEPDRDWAKAKLNKDEEGAVGLVMKKRLAREGFELRFENSDRYMEWAGGDDE